MNEYEVTTFGRRLLRYFGDSSGSVRRAAEAEGYKVVGVRFMGTRSRRCPHCHSTAKHVSCSKCQRDMCDDCISYHTTGKVCGMCYDQLVNG